MFIIIARACLHCHVWQGEHGLLLPQGAVRLARCRGRDDGSTIGYRALSVVRKEVFRMNYLEQFKYIMGSIVSGLLSLFFPIRDFMYAMLIVFVLNYVFGWIAGMTHGEHWDWKKSMVFFRHCALFFVMTAAVFVTGHFLHNEEETVGVVKVLCGVAIWFYGTNIVRNWRQMLIEDTTMWKVAGFIYYVLTLKMIDKIPYLSEYLKSTDTKAVSNSTIE